MNDVLLYADPQSTVGMGSCFKSSVKWGYFEIKAERRASWENCV